MVEVWSIGKGGMSAKLKAPDGEALAMSLQLSLAVVV